MLNSGREPRTTGGHCSQQQLSNATETGVVGRQRKDRRDVLTVKTRLNERDKGGNRN